MPRGPGPFQRAILAAVAEHGPITTHDLAELLGCAVDLATVYPAGYDTASYWDAYEHGRWLPELRSKPTAASATARRRVRRAVAALIDRGLLVRAELEKNWPTVALPDQLEALRELAADRRLRHEAAEASRLRWHGRPPPAPVGPAPADAELDELQAQRRDLDERIRVRRAELRSAG